jgi:NAD(P)-dependent dehydrogenase (short-subunit alcohol dehydrogenase family)
MGTDRTFGPETTTDEVLAGVDLSGTHAVVTGASTGLGEETARALAAHGASVTLAVRDPERGVAALERIRASAPGATLGLVTVDLASFASIRRAAAELFETRDRIDLLINNAGVMACPPMRTADGFELQFGTNHLGHFLWTVLLWPAVLAAPSPRIVALSSAGHRFGDVDLDDVNFDHTPYDPWVAYGRSKTANALFAVEAQRRLGDRGLAFSVHPGTIQTELARHLTHETLTTLIESLPPDEPMVWKSVPAGAATTVYAATDPGLAHHGGAYLEDCGVAAVTDDPASRHGVRDYAVDPDRAAALWERSTDWVDADIV